MLRFFEIYKFYSNKMLFHFKGICYFLYYCYIISEKFLRVDIFYN